MAQEPSVVVEPKQPNATPAAIIFIHGYNDDGNGWTNLAHTFQSASKLPHLKWIFPNAPFEYEPMANAWFTPRRFSPIPMPKRMGEEDAGEDDEDDEEGTMKSLEYISGLVDKEVEAGMPPERIVVGGFSQGCSMALLLGLDSKWRGKLGGIVGLSGYLPLIGKVQKMLEGESAPKWGSTRWFVAHGSTDQLAPFRYFKKYKERLDSWVGAEAVEAHVYEGMPHTTAGPEIRDLCVWLEHLLGTE